MKKLLITSPNAPDVRKELTDDEFAELLVNTFGTELDGTINAMQVQGILNSGNYTIIGETVWSLE